MLQKLEFDTMLFIEVPEYGSCNLENTKDININKY